MRRHLAAMAGACALLLGAGAGTALADTPTQAVQQAAGTSQSASSDATSTQYKPSNSATSVRIGSPGNDGSVAQDNSSTAASAAANLAGTTQQASQAQSGGGGTQAAEQAAATHQSADSSATSTQDHPSNSAISVRIGSPGNGGDVEQSNSSEALSAAANAAKTTQGVEQQQQGGSGGSCCGGGGVQAAEQKAKTDQSATSDATSKQIAPSNSAISVRIKSPGNDGSVSQSNSSAAGSFAGNLAKTDQAASQSQGGGGCKCGGDAVQAAGQFADTKQHADSSASSTQYKPSNSATSVRIASPGDGGDVHQSNDSFAGSFAGNAALTSQAAAQDQGGSGHGAGVQALEQDASTWQDADSSATSTQFHPSNDVTSVRIGSPGHDGSVDQSNSSTALSFAGNLAKTDQAAAQHQAGGDACKCGGDRVQAAGQFAWTGQSAHSDATSMQKGASNSVTPVWIGGNKDHGYSKDAKDGYGKDAKDGYGEDGYGKDGYGKDEPKSYDPSSHGGDVSQSNDSTALSAAVNLAATKQFAAQSQGGTSMARSPYDAKSPYDGKSHDPKACDCSSAGVQAVGQFAKTHQDADSSATSTQWHPSNTVAPVRIHSAGSDGSVDQANTSFAGSLALNAALTRQWVAQQQ